MTAALHASLTIGSEPIQVTLCTSEPATEGNGEMVPVHRTETWQPEQTAMIVCDVWDYHHSQNAVERLEAFAPRLNDVLIEARRRGVTIIHAPSDCMNHYRDHPARKRAQSAPLAAKVPSWIDAWCSAIPSEKSGVFPIDQADGGEDDDPQKLSVWRKKLADLGRNPQMPWQSQSPLITIDEDSDFISDSGSEVWNILQSRKIKNVVLTGVHINMCVLGRPFGLRQMARNGLNVALLRDLTDAMYNPLSWPYVDHHEGTRRVIEHIERYVCPTISSDQWIGGQEFHLSKVDTSTQLKLAEQSPSLQRKRHWELISLPINAGDKLQADSVKGDGTLWLRCTVFIPEEWIARELSLQVPKGTQSKAMDQRVWINGKLATVEPNSSAELTEYRLPTDAMVGNDVNLIVIAMPGQAIDKAFKLKGNEVELPLEGRWQFTLDNGKVDFSSLPLPAKFGMGPDVLFVP
jgi:nicotinamidase-related amidase